MTLIVRSDLAAAIMLITLWFGVVVPAQSAEPASSAVTETRLSNSGASGFSGLRWDHNAKP